MSAATRAASVAAVVLAIGAVAKVVKGGKKQPNPIRTGTPTEPLTAVSKPTSGGGTVKPDPIRTGDTD